MYFEKSVVFLNEHSVGPTQQGSAGQMLFEEVFTSEISTLSCLQQGWLVTDNLGKHYQVYSDGLFFGILHRKMNKLRRI